MISNFTPSSEDAKNGHCFHWPSLKGWTLLSLGTKADVSQGHIFSLNPHSQNQDGPKDEMMKRLMKIHQ